MRDTLAGMERAWICGRLAVSVARVDFLDPALAGEPDVRERGVRVEVRPVTTYAEGSIYASPSHALRPALCRIDLLESAPGAADRMHWHPAMRDGEPGDRTFEVAMPPDPVGWLTAFLRQDLGDFLARAGAAEEAGDTGRVAAVVPEIAAAVDAGLAWARTSPWPEVARDPRGMAELP